MSFHRCESHNMLWNDATHTQCPLCEFDSAEAYYNRPSRTHSLTIASWCFLGILAILAVVLLGGCTTWVKNADSATETKWVVAPYELIREIPGCENAIACAVRFTAPICQPEELPRVSRPVCIVLAQQPKSQLASYIVNHESLHCSGEDHP